MRHFLKILPLLMVFFSVSLWSSGHQGETITISYNTNNPPFKFMNASGQADGILTDIWKLWSKKTGIPVEFANADFNETVDMVRRGDADVNSGLFYTEDREKYLDFSLPLAALDHYIFIERSVYKPFMEKRELNAFKIGVPEGFTAIFAADKFPEAAIEVFTDFPELYDRALEGGIKVFISPRENFEFYLEEKGKSATFVILYNEPLYTREYLGAVRKGNLSLLESVNAGIQLISDSERDSVMKNWKSVSRRQNLFRKEGKVVLSAAEKRWAENNSPILISGDPDWPPNSMYDGDGNYTGILSDIWKLIEEKSGLETYRIRSDSWAHTIDMIREGKIHIIDCVSETPHRQEFMDFSEILFTSSIIIVGREDAGFINGLGDIGNMSLAVQEGVSEIEYIKKDHPDIKLAYYSDPDQAYKDVSSGKIDLFLRHQSDFSYKKKELMLTNLKIVGPSDYSREYRVGIKKGDEELLSIINKTLLTITPEEYGRVFDKWHGTETLVTDYSLIGKVSLLAFALIAFIFYWNRTLSKEIGLRKRTQAKLQVAMEEARSATEAKSRFLANMSHEIRTPMNAILGFSELLAKTPLTPSQETYLSTIRSGGSTLMGIINDILDISKVEAGKLEMNYSYFDIVSLIFDLSQFFNAKIMEKNLTLKTVFSDKMPSVVYLDELRLRQILINLIGNAIKFTEHGVIEIECSHIHKDNGNIDLTVCISDTGIGIKREKISLIFEAFEQASETDNSKKYQGTGLGLAIAKKFTGLMNGTVRVESELGKGSKFILEFYDVKADPEFINGKHNESADLDGIRFETATVLIADDIESNRFLLKEICSRYGLETVEAENGREALEAAKLRVPDLILMDMRMPVMDGYEATDRIKNDPVLKKIPVIAVTASVMQSEKLKIEKHGFDGYIRKPVLRNELISEMLKYLKHVTVSADKADDTGDDGEISDYESLAESLSGEIGELVDEARSKQNFNQIKLLASRLKTLAGKHGSSKLERYAGLLHRSAERYDIEYIKIHLDNFDDLISGLNGKKEA